MRSTRWLPSLATGLALVAGCASEEPRGLTREERSYPGAEGQVETGPPSTPPTSQVEELRPPAHDLDGKAFTVKLSAPGVSEVQSDLVFTEGTLEASAWRAHGFTAVPYHVQPLHDDEVAFQATADGQGGAVSRWTGAVRDGDHVRGVAVLTLPGQEPVQYTFEGAAK